MFTIDGVPMLFMGNELADSDPKHSMFGKTPMDWKQLESGVGRSVKGCFAEKPLLARGAVRIGERSFRLDAYGFAVFAVTRSTL